MFMEREELRYGMKLGKVQLRYSRIIGIVLGIVYLFEIISGNFVGILANDMMRVEQEQCTRFTTGVGYALLLYLLGFIIWNCLYENNRAAQEIYPQTNRSRFVANIMVEYFVIIVMTISSIVLNFMLVIALPIIQKHWENVVIDGSFMMTDVAVIAMVVFGYGLLLQSIVLLVFSCIRKFKIWTLSILFIGVAWMTNNMNSFFTIAIGMGGFYTEEKSFLIFMVKVVVTHVVLNLLSYILQIHTEFRGERINKKQGIAFGVIIGIITFAIFVGVGNIVAEFSDGTYNVTVEEIGTTEVKNPDTESFVIDISHLEKGSKIQIETMGNVILQDSKGEMYDSILDNEYKLYVNSLNDLTVLGDSLKLEYRMGEEIWGGVDMLKYLQPEFTYELEGNTLKLRYECVNPDVKILYVNNSLASKYQSDSEERNGIMNSYSYLLSNLNIWVE